MNAGIYRVLPGLIKREDSMCQLSNISTMVTGNCPVDIIESVCSVYGISLGEIKGDNRRAYICEARHLSMYLIAKKYGLGPTQVSRYFNHSHSTVIHAMKKVIEYYETDKHFRARVASVVFKKIEMVG